MITLAQVHLALVSAIEADVDIAAAAGIYGRQLTTMLGNPGTAPLWAEDDTPAVCVWAGEGAADYGDGGMYRDIPASIRWAAFDQTADADGRRTTFAGVQTAHAIGTAIVTCVRTWVESAGGWLQACEYRAAAPEDWPMCGGTIACSLRFPRSNGIPEPELIAVSKLETVSN